MSKLFKKSSGTIRQKTISQQNLQSLVKKAVDSINSKFDQNIIDQIFLTLKTQDGCELIVKVLVDSIDQYCDNDLALLKTLKLFYLCQITNSTYFRNYAQCCLPEIASISILNFKKAANIGIRNTLRIISQQIYLNLTINSPLPSPRQLNLEKYVQSPVFLQVKTNNDQENNVTNLRNNSATKNSIEDQKGYTESLTQLSNCQFVENLIEWDNSEENTPPKILNEECENNFDSNPLFSSAKISDQAVKISKSLSASLFQNAPENVEDVPSLISINEKQIPISITKSTPKLFDFPSQSPNEQLSPQVHRREREKSYDPPKNDISLLDDLNMVNTILNGPKNDFNDVKNNFNEDDKNIIETKISNNQNYSRINSNVTNKNMNENNNTNLTSFFQPSNRSHSVHTFSNTKNLKTTVVDYDDRFPFAKQISSDSPSDIITSQYQDISNKDNQDGIFESLMRDNQQSDTKNNQNISPLIADNKTRSCSLDLFTVSSSLPIKPAQPSPTEQAAKAVRFPTSPNFKDIQNKEFNSIRTQKSVNFTDTINKSDTDIDLANKSDSSKSISKSNTTEKILDLSNNNLEFLDLSSSANNINKNVDIKLNNNNPDILLFSDTLKTTTNQNNKNNAEIIDLSDPVSPTGNSSSNMNNNINDNEIIDLSGPLTPTHDSQLNNTNNTDIFDLSVSLNTSNEINNNHNNKNLANQEILDLSAPVSPTKNNMNIIDLSNSLNSSNNGNNNKIIDLSEPASPTNVINSKKNNIHIQRNKNNIKNTEIIDLSNPVRPIEGNKDNKSRPNLDILDLSSPSESINPTELNDDKSDSDSNNVGILELANSTTNSPNFLPNYLNSSQCIPNSASSSQLFSVNSPNNRSKLGEVSSPTEKNNNFNSIATPQFIPQTPPANISLIERKRRKYGTTNTNNLGDSIFDSYLPPISSHQRSYSNTTPVSTKTSIQLPTIPEINFDTNNPNNNTIDTTTTNNNETMSINEDKNIIPLIETKTQTIALSAPHMLQNQQQSSITIGDSSLLPTSDSPLYSQRKKKKPHKTKDIKVDIRLDSNTTFHSLISNSESQSSSVLETIKEEDETNTQFEPISLSKENGIDDNFELIAIKEEEEEKSSSNFEDNFEPIIISKNEEEELIESSKLAPEIEFEPISPREDNMDNDDQFEPISPRDNQINDDNFEPISPREDQDRFEPINSGPNCQQFEPINSNSTINTELTQNDNLNPNLFLSMNNSNNNNLSDPSDQFEPISTDENILDQFEPINNNENTNDDNDAINVNNDDVFEPIKNNNDLNDNENMFEPIEDANISSKQEHYNFEPIDDFSNDNNIRLISIKSANNDIKHPVLDASNYNSNNPRNIKFTSVISDSSINPHPSTEPIIIQSRTKKIRVKKVNSLQVFPAINLDSDINLIPNSTILIDDNL